MNITRLGAIIGGLALGTAAGAALQLNAASASGASHDQPLPAPSAIATPAPSPSPSPRCPAIKLALAFTTNVSDTSALHLHLPWGKPGDPEGQMVEDYGAYNGTTIRKHLPVHDVTTNAGGDVMGRLHTSPFACSLLFRDVAGLPTLVEGGFGRAVEPEDDEIPSTGHRGEPIAFLYGHVREFDAQNGQRVEAGALIAKSGGDPDDPGAGFSDMANVHFEVIESPHPLIAHAGTVNPHQFLENLYDSAAHPPLGCSPSR